MIKKCAHYNILNKMISHGYHYFLLIILIPIAFLMSQLLISIVLILGRYCGTIMRILINNSSLKDAFLCIF